jgi:hypothetical protein
MQIESGYSVPQGIVIRLSVGVKVRVPERLYREYTTDGDE